MPSGLRSVVVAIAVEVDNPASQVKLSDIEGTVFHSGKVFGRVSVDPFVLEARSLETYHLDAVLTLDGDISLLDLMSLLKGNVIEECTIDFYAKASLKGGVSKKLEFKQLPLKELYDLVKK